MQIDTKRAELEQLRRRVHELETEIRNAESSQPWSATGFYGSYYATAGFLLGIFGAIVSLAANAIAAPIAGRHPLELIRVYLTFPLGGKALQLATGGEDAYVIGDGVIITFGVCLYLATGMLLGVPFHVVLTRLVPDAALGKRLLAASVLSTVLWLIVFYGVLVWLQPLLFGGSWITDNSVLPWWVAWATHLVFGWTMALVYPLGRYEPYVSPTESAA